MTAACAACIAVPDAGEIPAGPALQVSLPGIHCAACIGKIERGLRPLPGVKDVRVNLSLKRLSVTGTAPMASVLNALAGLGFDAYALDTQALNQTQDMHARGLLVRLAVAGFAMMNVMLLSVAIWSGAEDATRHLFHLISAVIAVPVVIYSAQPFYENAWKALRVGRLNMDVPISLAIILASAMSLFEALNGGRHAYFDAALSLTFFLLIGRYLDYQTRKGARSAAKELTALEVHTTQRLVGPRVETLRVSEVVLGDTLLVATGARVPLDGTLQSDNALMDRSFVTGESEAVTVTKGAIVQAGEINIAAPFEMRVTAIGEDTSLRRMAALVDTAENGRNSYTSLADRAAQIYAPLVHLLAFAAFLGWIWATGDMHKAMSVAIAVLIITCPCALGLAVPAVTTAAVSRLFSNGYLVKHATALERLAEVDHVVFDKTGTLTTPTVVLPGTLSSAERSVALSLAQVSQHPVSRAIVAALHEDNPANITNLKEISGCGVEAIWQGITVRLGRGGWLIAEFDGLGLQIGDSPAMEIGTPQTLRAGVSEMLADLDLGAEILTGDTSEAAEKLSQQLNLPVTANVLPLEKLAHLTSLSDAGRKVLMVGDGLNDTAALAAAHASLSPASALDVARSASDVVILRPSFAQIPMLLRVARMCRTLSQQNFAIAGLYNCIAVPIALAGYATPLAAALAMSLSSITVLMNAQRMRYVK